MVNKDHIRDYALVAYLLHMGHFCTRKNGDIWACDMPDDSFQDACRDYKTRYKPVIDGVRRILKTLHAPQGANLVQTSKNSVPFKD